MIILLAFVSWTANAQDLQIRLVYNEITYHDASLAITSRVDNSTVIHPVAQVYDVTNSKYVTNQFYLNYYIKNGNKSPEYFSEDNRMKNKSVYTNSKIARLYGMYECGNYSGTDTVMIVATPISEGVYSTVITHYTVTLETKAASFLIKPGNEMNVWKGFMYDLPSVSVFEDEAQVNAITEYYDVSYDHTDGLRVVTAEDFPRGYGGGSLIYNLRKITGDAGSEQNITIHCRPKTVDGVDYSKIYPERDLVVPVHITERTSTEPVRTQLFWWMDNRQVELELADNGNFILPKPLIYDELGNNITDLFKYNYIIEDYGGTGNSSMWTGNNGIWGSWEMHAGTQQAGTIKVSVTNTQMSNGGDYAYAPDNYTVDGRTISYSQITDTCFVIVRKKELTIRIDPVNANIPEGVSLTHETWKVPTITAYYGGEDYTNGCQLLMGIPTDAAVTGVNSSVLGTYTDPKTGVEYNLYDARYSFPNESWATWSIRLTSEHNNFVFIARNWDSAHWSEGAVATYTVNPIDKIEPSIQFSDELVTATIFDRSGAVMNSILQPELTITNSYGRDISHYYNSPVYTITAEDGSTSNLPFSIDENGKVSFVGNTVPDVKSYIVSASATAKDATYYKNTAVVSYRIIVKVNKFAYTIETTSNSYDDEGYVDDISNLVNRQLGFMHFTSPGEMEAGTQISGVPGVNIQFGMPGDNSWTVVQADPYDCVSYGDPVVIGEDNIPVSGTFYKFMPYTNGFLSLFINWEAGEKYALYGVENGKIVTGYQILGDGSYDGKVFPYPMIAGRTYYLINLGGSEGTNAPIRMYGFNYYPAYVLTDADMKPSKQSTTFVNGYTGTVSYLLRQPSRLVSFDTDLGNEGLSDNDISSHLTLNTRSGEAIARKRTSDIDNADHRIQITAKVKNEEKGDAVVKRPFIRVFITDIPTYMVKDGETPIVGQKVSTTNIRTNITMTYGGWQEGSGPYMKSKKQTNLTDYWKIAKTDTVGQNGMAIDGFRYASQGGQNPLDENGCSYNVTIANNNHSSYELPCRGTYLKFEPEESGTLIAYVLQNGACDYDGNIKNIESKFQIKWRPLFITDETGNPVELDNHWATGMENLLPSTSTAGEANDHYGAYTECNYRVMMNDTEAQNYLVDEYNITDGASYIEDDKVYTYDFRNTSFDWSKFTVSNDTNGTLREKYIQRIMDVWGGYNSVESPQEAVIAIKDEDNPEKDKCYVLVSKAYVRYSFQVKAGKTYYIWCSNSKLSFCGFSFVPSSYNSEDYSPEDALADNPTVVMTDDMVAYDANEQNTFSNAVAASFNINESGVLNTYTDFNVQLQRKFGKDKWTSICLPFSINESKFKKIFGNDAIILTYDRVQDGVVHFVQHAYHMIEASRPYFIKPSIDVPENPIVNNVTMESRFVDVNETNSKHGDLYIDTNNQFNVVYDNRRANDYLCKGTYKSYRAPQGSYLMAGSKLYETVSEFNVPPFRALLEANSNLAKRITGFALSKPDGLADTDDLVNDEIFSGIEEIFDEGSNNNNINELNGVYNMLGQKVGNTDADLQKLPRGIYIVNGKKRIVF